MSTDPSAQSNKIMDIHTARKETNGNPRIHSALKRQGELCGRNRIARIMRNYGIKPRMAKRFCKHSRRIIGLHFSKSLNSALAKAAALMAIEESRPGPGLIFHTDQGLEFANKNFKAVMDQYGLQISKSRKGCCWDSANMESFYHTLKNGMVYFCKFNNIGEALAHIMDYIRFFNHDRLHSGLKYEPPMTNETIAA